MKVDRTLEVGKDGKIDGANLQNDLKSIFACLRRIALGDPVAATRLENWDACYVVHQFGTAANTDETTPHRLGRIPVGLISVEIPAAVAGTAPIVGSVTFGSRLPTAGLVTLRCSAASKLAAVILF